MNNKALELVKTKLWLIEYEIKTCNISDKRYAKLMDKEVILTKLEFELKRK